MIFFAKNLKNLFLTLFRSFFEDLTRIQNCKTHNSADWMFALNFKFLRSFRVIVKKLLKKIFLTRLSPPR